MKDFLGIHDKYIWWGILGIGVAFLFWYLTSKQISSQGGSTNTVTVPYLVPQTSTGASPTADTSLSNQPNIVGNSSNSQVPNGSNPFGVATSVGESPNTFGFLPQLIVSPVSGVNNAVGSGQWTGQTAVPINFQSPPNTQPQTAH